MVGVRTHGGVGAARARCGDSVTGREHTRDTGRTTYTILHSDRLPARAEMLEKRGMLHRKCQIRDMVGRDVFQVKFVCE